MGKFHCLLQVKKDDKKMPDVEERWRRQPDELWNLLPPLVLARLRTGNHH